MMDHKYVKHSELGFVLWRRTDRLWHAHVGKLLGRADGEIESAGFVRFEGNRPQCFGHSETLGIASKPGDSEALAEQLGITPPNAPDQARREASPGAQSSAPTKEG